MQDEKQKSGVKWLATGIYLTLFSAIGLAGYLYLPSLLPQQNNEIVVIKGEAGPFKTKPEDPGGKIITNQDSKVMEMLGALTPEKEDVETLLPPSGGPELPPVDVKTTETAATEDTPVDGDKAEDSTAEAPAKTIAEGSKTEAGQPATSLAMGQNDNSTTSSEASEASTKTGGGIAGQKTENGDVTTPVAKPPVKTIVATPKPTTKEEAKAKDEPSITTKRVATEPGEPTYMIQLAAFRKEDIASEQAGLLLKKHETRLQGVTIGTMRIDTGDNGIFWRIVSEPLPREAADTICASLKRAGQDCILRKFTAPEQ
ncbi:MAG: SPOR domain-containing protein [Alphaproteobacteria bacterium]